MLLFILLLIVTAWKLIQVVVRDLWLQLFSFEFGYYNLKEHLKDESKILKYSFAKLSKVGAWLN